MTTSQPVSEIIEQARRLALAEQKDKAVSLLREVLVKHPDHIPALLWLAGLTPDLQEGIAILKRVLVLDPDNVQARQGLASLQAKAAPKSEPTPSPSPSPAELAQPVVEEQQSPPDPIAAARAVIWPFKGLKRPIGDLLDEGLISKNDLRYAASQAYDKRVRWAAATLLGDQAPPKMSVEQARAVVWSFSGGKGPLGELLDAGKISDKDLAWAARKAYDPRARQAARVLLTARQSRPQEPARPVAEEARLPKETPLATSSPQPEPARTRAGALQVVPGSDYLRRQEETKQRRAVYLLFPALTLWLSSLGLSLILIVLGLAYPGGLIEFKIPLWVSGLGVAMLLVACVLLRPIERLLEERDQYYLGRQGEERTVKALRRCLDGRWTLFCNVVLPGDRGDIDAVLVGPSGVYVLEIKSYNGHFLNRGEGWFRCRGPARRQLDKNPSRQAKANAARLSEYLSNITGTEVWVEPRVVWAGPGKLSLQQPAVYIWFLDNMGAYVEALATSPTKPEKLIQQVRDTLLDLQPVEG
ncbi:MAG: NERD domain-containing protein [Anaerolineae bacterium]|nr:NERD domain-containing protein [Anaerolineae bacterium]